MAVLDKQILGAKGLDTRSKFLISKDRSQVLENFKVSNGTRNRRSQYSRWKYDKYCSNALRFIGTYNCSYALIKDAINTYYNSFDSAQSSTIEIRFRLHGVGGYSLRDIIYLASRQIHGSGYTFELKLIAATTPTYETYYPRLVISDSTGTGTHTINFSTATTIRHGQWYTLTIIKDNANNRFRALLNGVFTENVAFAGTPEGAQGILGTTRDDNTYADIVIGCENDLTDFAPVDVDEFRLWNEARSDANVLAYYDKELPETASIRTNLICYATFQDEHDGYSTTDEVNTNCRIFFGSTTPYKDVDDFLVFDGTSMYGKLSPIGGTLTIPYNLWGGGDGGKVYKVSEVAFQVLKLKPGNIIGPLELYYDGGTSKYGFRYKFTNNGATTYISSGGIINTADLGVTTYYVALRSFETATARLELWVNGTLLVTTNYVGVHGAITGEPGRYVGAGPTGITRFSAIRLKWFRVYDAEMDETEYFTTKYNQEVDEFKLNEYSHGVVTSTRTGAAARLFTGTDTAWNLKFNKGAPADNQRYVVSRENQDGFPGENYQDANNALNVGAQTIDTINADSTGDPWSAAAPQITNKEGYIITSLLTRYNQTSWRNIKTDKGSFKKIALINSLVSGGYDRDKDPLYTLELYCYVNGASNYKDEKCSFIGGTLKSLPRHCRYLGAFKSLNGSQDVVISIVGTAFNVFDRTTKTLTQYPISILPNEGKPFIGDFLEGDLYLTDGKTKIHVYEYKRELRVVKWGFARGEKPTLSAYTAAGPWSGTFQYAYCYYNREIDQYGPLCFPKTEGTGNEITLANNYAVQLDSINKSPDFYEGVTDIAIFRTKDTTAGIGIVGHYWLNDFTRGNSRGWMDWSQNDNSLEQRYPIELASSETLSGPPDSEFVVAHNKRLWMADGSYLRYSRIGDELHEGILKSETYLYPYDAFIPIQGNRAITAAASFYDKILFVFTAVSMDMVLGSDEQDFEIRRIHDGVGCVSHRTLIKYGESMIWLGLDDLYNSRGSVPTPLDPEGKISKYIRDNFDKTRMSNAFAILNKALMIYELHFIRNDGVPCVLYYDFKVNEFTIGKDVRASYAAEVVDSYNNSNIFLGTSYGYIVAEDSTGMTYQPTSGSVKTTVSSINLGTNTLTVAASNLQITEAGLIGNTVYIVSQAVATLGSILKVVVIDNTATTITFEVGEEELVFGTSFVPANGDIVYIGPIFTRWKTPSIFFTSIQDGLQPTPEGSGLAASELHYVDLIHNRSSSSGNAYLGVYRDGQTALSKIFVVPELNQDFSRVMTPDSTRGRFIELELVHLDSVEELEIIGYSLGINVDEGVISGAS